MAVFVLLIQAIALLILSYKYFFSSNQNQLNKPPYLQKETLNFLQKEQLPHAKIYSKEKGDDFEKFVIRLFDFKSNRFVLKEWRSDKYIDGIYPESNHYPDLEIELVTKSYTSSFAVECKFRSSWSQEDTIDWAKSQQIINYGNYSQQKGFPVFIILGVGGSAKDPDETYIFSLDKVNYRFKVHYNFMQQFRRKNTNSKLFYDTMSNTLK